MKTILAPIDFSEVTQWVMAEAADLARKMNGRLVLLNVTNHESINRDQLAFRNMIADLDEHPLQPTRAAELAGGADASDDEPVSGDSIQLIGEPVSVILLQAEKLGADYIVMGSHGRSRLHDLVFGSVAEGVLRDAPCPVMLVPSRRKQKFAQTKRTQGSEAARTSSTKAPAGKNRTVKRVQARRGARGARSAT